MSSSYYKKTFAFFMNVVTVVVVSSTMLTRVVYKRHRCQIDLYTKNVRQRRIPPGRVSQLTWGESTCSVSCCDRSLKSPYYISAWTAHISKKKKLVWESSLVLPLTFIAFILEAFYF